MQTRSTSGRRSAEQDSDQACRGNDRPDTFEQQEAPLVLVDVAVDLDAFLPSSPDHGVPEDHLVEARLAEVDLIARFAR